LESSKKCVTTYLPKPRAPKINDAQAVHLDFPVVPRYQARRVGEREGTVEDVGVNRVGGAFSADLRSSSNYTGDNPCGPKRKKVSSSTRCAMSEPVLILNQTVFDDGNAGRHVFASFDATQSALVIHLWEKGKGVNIPPPLWRCEYGGNAKEIVDDAHGPGLSSLFSLTVILGARLRVPTETRAAE